MKILNGISNADFVFLKIAKRVPKLKPTKQPIKDSKNVTPIAFNKKIMFQIDKKEGNSCISLSIY